MWYSWGYRHTSPTTFVSYPGGTLSSYFRALRADNVTWLWTINIINDTQRGRIPRPAQWWPSQLT